MLKNIILVNNNKCYVMLTIPVQDTAIVTVEDEHATLYVISCPRMRPLVTYNQDFKVMILFNVN